MTAPTYDDALTLRDARALYFQAFGFSEAHYSARWVSLKKIAGVIPIGFPNTAGRIRAVKMHDIHHVLTGYAANYTGEAEIGAWELAAGCGRHPAAWILNLFALQYGVFIGRPVLRAAARGRRSATLYHMRELDEAVLQKTVGEMRRELRLDAPVPDPTSADMTALTGYLLLGFLLWAVPLAMVVGLFFAFR
jgi:hypothetical protein